MMSGPGGNNNNNNLGGGGGGGPMGDFDSPYNTYGLSTSFLEGLGIQGPLYNKIFIANVSIRCETVLFYGFDGRGVAEASSLSSSALVGSRGVP